MAAVSSRICLWLTTATTFVNFTSLHFVSCILRERVKMASVYKSLSKSDAQQKPTAASNGVKKNKQRVLILSSRGVTYRFVMASDVEDPDSYILTTLSICRHRHLLNDLASMLPHGRKDVKFDSKSKLNELNELAELYNCNNVLFFEARKGKDLYIWLSKVPNGPTIKMHLQNRKEYKNTFANSQHN